MALTVRTDWWILLPSVVGIETAGRLVGRWFFRRFCREDIEFAYCYLFDGDVPES